MTFPAVKPELMQYPLLYTAARAALFRCEQIDECQQWANKASAMASYARQSKDMDLLHMAERIRARAVRRCGELLIAIPPVPPQQTRKAAGLVTRTTAAADAGLSEWQKNEAIQVAKVLEPAFEKLVEADDPASIRTLAKLGAAQRVAVRREKDTKRLKRFAMWCYWNKPSKVAGALDSEDVRAIRAWCDQYLATA